VQAALRVAFDAHDGQLRKSGEPFITHPVAVASILGEMGMDRDTIVAGLLHDTVEDTVAVTFEGIQARFGPAVRRIVEGETKVSKISSKVSKQGRDGYSPVLDVKADDLQQMFIAMTEEVRVIIVKARRWSTAQCASWVSWLTRRPRSLLIGCITCARSTRCRRTNASASRTRRWRCLRRSPSCWACTG
jgi:(p)ppGpp synthase/HD superfamily hydrolase